MPDLSPASTLLSRLPDRTGFGGALLRRGPGVIDLAGGNPDPASLPVAFYRDAVREVTEAPEFAASMRYAPLPGLDVFRAHLAAREDVDPARVIVTAGGMAGLALATLGTLDAGDTIVVDDPLFPVFLRVLELIDRPLHVEPVRVDADGIDVELLEHRIAQGLRPRAVFTVPSFQNPTGAVLSPEKGARLVDLAERHGFMIFADDPYRDLAFPGTTLPMLRDSGHVLRIGTFSKTLGPALRLGWIVTPPDLAASYVRLRNRIDGQASGFLQQVALRIVSHPEFADHLASAAGRYAAKCATLTRALTERFGDDLEILPPRGGFFLWAGLRDASVDPTAWFDAAQDRGVTYQRGEWFAARDGERFRGRLRLSFSEPDAAQLQEGAERLHAAWLAVR